MLHGSAACVKDKDTNDSSINCHSSTALIFNDCLPETDLNDNVDDDPPDENNEIDDTTKYKLRGGMKLVKRKRAKIIRSVRFKKEIKILRIITENNSCFNNYTLEKRANRLNKRL